MGIMHKRNLIDTLLAFFITFLFVSLLSSPTRAQFFSVDACIKSDNSSSCAKLSPTDFTFVQSSYLVFHLTGLSSETLSTNLWSGEFKFSITTVNSSELGFTANQSTIDNVDGRRGIEKFNATHRIPRSEPFPIYAISSRQQHFFPLYWRTAEPYYFVWKFESSLGEWESPFVLKMLQNNGTIPGVEKPDVPVYNGGVGNGVVGTTTIGLLVFLSISLSVSML